MRILLCIALSLTVSASYASAQTATPPAPPGGVGGPAAQGAEAVPTPPAPVAAAPESEAPPAADQGVADEAEVVHAPPPDASLPPPSASPLPPADQPPAPEAPPSVLAPLPTFPSEARRPVPVSSAPPPRPKPAVRRDAGAPLALAIGPGLLWNDDPGYLLVGEKARPQLEVMASYDLLQLTKRIVVSLGGSLRRGRESDGQLSILDNTVQAELIARYATPSWLWPHARASVGAAFTRVDVGDRDEDGSLSDRDVALASSFGGGLTVRTPARALETEGGRLSSLSLGVLCEAGYTLARDATFTAVPGGGDPGIERSAVNLGSLSRRGPYLRVLAVVRF